MYEVRTDSLYGMVTKLSYGSLYVDIDGNNRSVVSLRGDKSAEKAYVLNTGMMSSLYESTVLEELTGVESVSTVSIFAEAEAEGIDIVRVHEGNLSEQIGSLRVSESVKEAVRTAVNAGNIVTITAENVTIGDWTGAGYIITDPSTGAGAYKISGGVGDGETDGGSLSELANLLLVTATFANAGLAAVDTIMLLMPYLTGAIVLSGIGGVLIGTLLAVMAATILIASLFVESMLIENYNRYVETGDSSYLEADAWMSIGLGVNLAASGIMYHYMELLAAGETSESRIEEIDVSNIPDLSSKAIKHPMNDHMPQRYANQLKYMSRESAEKYLSKNTFFNKMWDENQVKNALNYGYKEALSKGFKSGKYTFKYLGEDVSVYLKDGVFKTGYGKYSFTYEELLELLNN